MHGSGNRVGECMLIPGTILNSRILSVNTWNGLDFGPQRKKIHFINQILMR